MAVGHNFEMGPLKGYPSHTWEFESHKYLFCWLCYVTPCKNVFVIVKSPIDAGNSSNTIVISKA